ncbi:ABC transporter permease [Lacrimispora sp. 210928-DFI.3.58]|uniref:ABC transporter permease n=1 Tax=Lacrimispora sp. 210928-DFI.3.58 TaxID=2883214 RepID=UPI001D0731F3|nr:ABC transporter permease subunit [Lacrimispora sp. 210928-DFI.3.58]MCB7318955.1 ABC transporter permease subunit [Lacrimispora sp. 210928-DFI.3.58]
MKNLKNLLPSLAALAGLFTAYYFPDSDAHPAAVRPYFAIILLVVLAVTLVLFAVGVVIPSLKEQYERKAPFYAGVLLFLSILNILTVKTAVLPVLYFPSLDRVFGVLVEDAPFIGKCFLYSLRLQLLGWFGGAAAGILTGIAIGFNRHARYWIYPLVRVLGPIPSTAWIPLVLVSFPTVVSASAFLIGLAVWFPTSVLTSSGIASIQNSYFEAAATLGASGPYTILRVGIPAAMPHMFIGLFNGTTSSFITLVTAEMLGAKYGIGWYINWQKDMMAYANVYAGLIVMSISCYCIITLLFRVRDKLLVWQKGVIKW